MIKIGFPANRPDIAFAMGEALMKIGGQNVTATTFAERLADGLADGSTTYSTVAGTGELHRVTPEAHQAVAAAIQVHTHQHPAQPGTTAAAPHDGDAELSHTAADSSRRDMKGVAFDPAYCANAAEPFYGSGKEKGQWKTKRGVAAEVYAAWYAAQLAGATQAASDEDSDNTAPVQTGAAFGAAPVSSVTAPAPRNAGEFMAWVAEKQTAGKLTQDAINAAYVNLGIRVQDLFPPTPENIIANNIASLHRELSAVAGA